MLETEQVLPIYEPSRVLERGFIEAGDSGSGKSSGFLSLSRQIPGAQFVLDPKASGPEVPRFLEEEARRRGVPFRYFSIEAEWSHGLNIIEQLGRTSSSVAVFAEAFVHGLGTGAGLSHSFFMDMGKDRTRSIAHNQPHIRTFEEWHKTSEGLNERDRHNLSGYYVGVGELAGIASLNIDTSDESIPREVRANSIDFMSLIEHGGLAYFRIPRLHGLIIPIVHCILAAAFRVNSSRPDSDRCPALMFVDEFASICGTRSTIVEQAIMQGRDYNLTVGLGIQGYSQLADARSDAYARQIFSLPCRYWGSSDLVSNDLFKSSSVTEEFALHPQMMTEVYKAFPTLRAQKLEGLCEAQGQGCFLARIPNSTSGQTFRWGRQLHAMSLEEFRAMRAKGFFTRSDELEGAVYNRPFEFFKATEPHPRPQKKQVTPDIDEALRRAAAVT